MSIKHIDKSLASLSEKTFFYIKLSSIVAETIVALVGNLLVIVLQ